jgi:hypothetical protein
MKTSFGILARLLLATTTLLFYPNPEVATAEAGPRILSDAAWRTDIQTVSTLIQEIHPRPFRSTDRNRFEAATTALLEVVPGLTDKEIMVQLAALVALIGDGHTRLSIPREHPEVGLEFGHTPTDGPAYPALRFRQLPLVFEQFDDGVYVIAASTDFAHLVGLRLHAIDKTPVAEAMEAVQAITFSENDQLGRLMGADRLSLPEALQALGIANSANTVALEFVDKIGVASTVSVSPLPQGPVSWADPFAGKTPPLRLKNPTKKFWSEYVPGRSFVYMQMDEISDDNIPLAEFVVNTMELANEHDARLIIDVRNNFGGSGELNRTLVTSIIRNESLNRHDRTFVLIGRRTFSAAQMLVNELEQYTRVTFVGEPTGSRPDNFGDPKKIRLEHSGLTLRVSRLHWSSYTAFDKRESTYPDFPVFWTSKDYFAGGDPALTFAHSVEDVSLKDLLRRALARGDMQQVARYTLDRKLSEDSYREDFSAVLVQLGNEFESADQPDIADLAYQVGLYFFPEHEGLKMARENLVTQD